MGNAEENYFDTRMRIGDIYIISNEFSKQEIGLVLLYKSEYSFKFLPIFFENDAFDLRRETILKSKMLTNIVYSGTSFKEQKGIFLIDESVQNPSFLKEVLKESKPFSNEDIDFDKIDLTGKSNDDSKITAAGGTSLPAEKLLFDKFYSHYFNSLNFARTDFRSILRATV